MSTHIAPDRSAATVIVSLPGLDYASITVRPGSEITVTDAQPGANVYRGISVDGRFHPLVMVKHLDGRDELASAVDAVVAEVRAAVALLAPTMEERLAEPLALPDDETLIADAGGPCANPYTSRIEFDEIQIRRCATGEIVDSCGRFDAHAQTMTARCYWLRELRRHWLAGAGFPECRNDGEPGQWVSWGATLAEAQAGALGLPLLAGAEVRPTKFPLTGCMGVVVSGPSASGYYLVDVRLADGSVEPWALLASEFRPA